MTSSEFEFLSPFSFSDHIPSKTLFLDLLKKLFVWLNIARDDLILRETSPDFVARSAASRPKKRAPLA